MAKLGQIINEVRLLSWNEKRELRQALDDELEQQQAQHVQPAQSSNSTMIKHASVVLSG